MEDIEVRHGRCLCGKIEFKAAIKGSFATCYCKMCQRWSSGAFMGVSTESFEVTQGEEHLTRFQSSEWAERAFCSKCGSNIYYHAPRYGGKSVALGAFDHTAGMEVQVQYFIDKKPKGFSLAETTKTLTSTEIEEMIGDK